ncbi:MAG: hypothetical protein QFY14_01070 [Candidatus Phytoplasma pruni]|nr:hypothetical protein [Candidatus Phytoplasma pruni]
MLNKKKFMFDYTVQDLREFGFTVSDFITSGYTVQELRNFNLYLK